MFTKRRQLASSTRGAFITCTALPTGAENTPPSEFRLWEWGDVKTTHGTFTLTKENAAAIKAEADARGIKFNFDYNHDTFKDNLSGPILAAGWYDVDVREDGFWLVNIEWTARAIELLQAREIRYYSPAFEVNQDWEIVSFLNCALTNLPATDNITPLVANAARPRPAKAVQDMRDGLKLAEMPLDDLIGRLENLIYRAYDGRAYLHKVFNSYVIFYSKTSYFRVNYAVDGDTVTLTSDAVEVEVMYNEKNGGQTMKALLITLGLKQDTPEVEAVAAARELMSAHSQILAATGTDSMPAALTALAGMKAAAAEVDTLKAENDTLKAAQSVEAVKSLVQAGVSAGKIPPALVDYWNAQPREAVEAYLAAAPAVAAQPQTPPNGSAAAAPNRTTVTADAAAAARAFGHNPAKVADYTAKKGDEQQ